jgi:N-acetylglucosamine-6-phosphate deacetylase
VQIILDGVHLAEETARVVWQSAAGRVALVTDAVAAAGMGDGTYLLGRLRGRRARRNRPRPGGVLAGSTLTMIEAVRNLHGLGVPLEQALAAASTVPASVIGLPTLSRLDVDFPADVIVLDDNLELDRVFIGGQARVVA